MIAINAAIESNHHLTARLCGAGTAELAVIDAVLE
jgi:hypothetical protein